MEQQARECFSMVPDNGGSFSDAWRLVGARGGGSAVCRTRVGAVALVDQAKINPFCRRCLLRRQCAGGCRQ